MASKLESTEDKAPEMKVNTITPRTMSNMQYRRSILVVADMSPYPTVVMVVTVK